MSEGKKKKLCVDEDQIPRKKSESVRWGLEQQKKSTTPSSPGGLSAHSSQYLLSDKIILWKYPQLCLRMAVINEGNQSYHIAEMCVLCVGLS